MKTDKIFLLGKMSAVCVDDDALDYFPLLLHLLSLVKARQCCSKKNRPKLTKSYRWLHKDFFCVSQVLLRSNLETAGADFRKKLSVKY